MATTLSFNTAKSMVISILQSSLTPYATTVDGSNAMYRSDVEIANAILNADTDVCNLIINTPMHPFQTTFVQTSSPLTGPAASLPARNGMILRVRGLSGSVASITFASTSISTSTDLVTSTAHGLVTGQSVQVAASVTLPTGLSAATTYYVYAPTVNTYGFCTTVYNAKNGTLIDITAQGSGTNTVTTQSIDCNPASSKDTVVQATNAPYIFASQPGVNAGWYYDEGDVIYFTSATATVVYTDYTLTSSPQASEPYLFAVVAGAISKLVKDGSDENMAAFYEKQYEMYLQQVASSAKLLPEIMSYKMAASAK